MSKLIFDIDNTLVKTNEEIKKRIAGFQDNVYPFPLPNSFFDNNPDVFLI